MNRRNLIRSLSLATLGAAAPFSFSTGKLLVKPGRSRVLRIAHITDVHLQPEKDAPKWFARCLHHLQDLKEKPDIIFNGGDTIMDALEQDRSRVQLQWDLWHKVVKNECSLTIEHCIGNHDVWGLQKAKGEDWYGKKYALEMMHLEKRYRSFDLKGWHFIVLDSTHVHADGSWYFAKLDEEQMDWLKQHLQTLDKEKPVLVLSHIPILSASVFYDGENVTSGNWEIPGSWMHVDSAEIIGLFHQHRQVKVCLSGHIHLLDRVDYNGVTYYCNGAVSGAWWDGDYHETKAGYAIVDLYDDGTAERQYIPYQV